MSDPGMAFTHSNPDEATHMTGIHKGGRMGRIHETLVRK
jgi:hypothetical protein